MHANVPHFHPRRIFFILTLHTLRQSLDWPLMSVDLPTQTRDVQWPIKKKFKDMWGVSAPVIFFILTLCTLRQWLDWSLISFSTSQPKHRMCSGPSKKISQNFTSSPITRKPLIAQILKRWLLVGKKVPYKFPNNIALKLLTLHGVNWQFISRPKNGKFFEQP